MRRTQERSNCLSPGLGLLVDDIDAAARQLAKAKWGNSACARSA
jgi:hypothetical protein